ncbi:TPA: hypothetical protein OKD83_004858, partial [Escherichia coli]|nr:hypothetical protein [Escherichia coli]
MKKKDILNVFGGEISTPLIREEIEQLLDILPQLAIDNFNNVKITVEQITQAVNDEIRKLILMLDEVDAGLFYEVLEE